MHQKDEEKAPKPLTCLQMAAVAKKLSISRGSVYKLLKEPDSNFPQSFAYMGGRGQYYLEHEIDDWLLAQREIDVERKAMRLVH
jgi:predicted DNA-binding transcriptional regulator AlpA